MGDEEVTVGDDARDQTPQPAKDELLAAAEELAKQEAEDRPARVRESSVRRKQRVVRGRAQDGSAILNVDESAGEERVRVRSLADEPGKVGARPPVDPVEVTEVEQASDDVMLDANGNEIASRPAEHRSDAAVITTAVFLADATRAYLDGRDELGADHAVTLDRLASLRRTLERFEAELDA
jgi:hypothetical protein